MGAVIRGGLDSSVRSRSVDITLVRGEVVEIRVYNSILVNEARMTKQEGGLMSHLSLQRTWTRYR